MILWMQVTKDKYELPLVVARSARELARMTGRKSATICAAIIRAKERGGRCQYVKVEVDDDEEL